MVPAGASKFKVVQHRLQAQNNTTDHQNHQKQTSSDITSVPK
jgi:hypothetical protein